MTLDEWRRSDRLTIRDEVIPKLYHLAACSITDKECRDWCDERKRQENFDGTHDCICDSVADAISKLGAYEDTGLSPECMMELAMAQEERRLVVLPCGIGSTVYVIASCKDINMFHDTDWETGTGAVECPFENQCSLDKCDSGQEQIFETSVIHWWLQGDEDGAEPEAFLEHMAISAYVGDFGKTVFPTRAEAEAALAEKGEAE